MKDKVASNLSRQAVAAADLIEAIRSDDETLNSDMIEGETGFFEAVEVALHEIGECEIQAAGLADYIKRLGDRLSRVNSRSEKLRGLIDQAFQIAEVKAHKFPSATITQKAVPPQLVVEDEALIPSKFYAPQPPRLDKKALKDAAKAGSIPGARMSNGGTTIQIRRA